MSMKELQEAGMLRMPRYMSFSVALSIQRVCKSVQMWQRSDIGHCAVSHHRCFESQCSLSADAEMTLTWLAGRGLNTARVSFDRFAKKQAEAGDALLLYHDGLNLTMIREYTDVKEGEVLAGQGS